MKTDILTSSYLDIRAKLHRIALKFLRDDAEASDALQDTFEKLWPRGEIATEAEARNKLVHTLRNTCIDRLRARHTVSLDAIEHEPQAAFEMPTEELNRYEKLIVSGLTEQQMIIYDLVTHQCLEYDEIATRLDMKVEAVRMAMSRARKRIRENIRLIER